MGVTERFWMVRWLEHGYPRHRSYPLQEGAVMAYEDFKRRVGVDPIQEPSLWECTRVET